MNLKGHTPVIRQYLNIKKNHPSDMVFFRMGDFYELFYDDAIEASKILGITLTHRGKSDEKPVVMAGVPVSAHENYLKRLIEAGKSVAICEQDSKPIIGKGLVQRKVVRIVTAGTLCDVGLVPERKQTWLLSISSSYGLSLLDVSTGELFWFFPASNQTHSSIEQVITVVSKFNIGEVLIPEVKGGINSTQKNLNSKMISTALKEVISDEKIVFRPIWEFDNKDGISFLQRRLELSSLEAIELTKAYSVLESISALIHYAEKNIGQSIKHLKFPKKIEQSEFVIIDTVAQKSLELTKPLYEDSTKNTTLISCLDRCQTSGGSRLLNQWLLSPLTNNKLLIKRQNSIKWLSRNQKIYPKLKGVIDVSRVSGRISLGNTSPKELFSLSSNLNKLSELGRLIENSKDENIEKIHKVLSDEKLNLLIEKISDCLSENSTSKTKDGGFVKKGFDQTLDNFRIVYEKSDKYLKKIEIYEREKTGISNLKLGFSPVHGYFFEVTGGQKHKVPDHYARKQTLKNSERFVTPEIKKLEEKILVARENSIEREKTIFKDLLRNLQLFTNYLFDLSESLSLLDVFATLSLKILENNWINPILTDKSEIFIIKGSHPVLVGNYKSMDVENHYYPNDTKLDNKKNMMLLTGPNMSGKSTYMKQVALITILGKMGAPVPAIEAKIGIIDRIFTRIGAADDIAGGRSTFMVEMTEAAKIIHASTNKSLIILDEIGRGTSTTDGLALAVAIATELAQENKSLCLFATHYFEITDLEKKIDCISNFHIATEEKEGQIFFLYELKKGPANKSFGLQVARLAGIPLSVIEEAKKVTTSTSTSINMDKTNHQLDHNYMSEVNLMKKITKEIENIDPNSCTPNNALNLLFKWKKILDEYK